MDNPHTPNYFWSGSLLGIGVGGAIVFMFGTKSGRQLVRNLLDISENMESTLAQLITEIESTLEEIETSTVITTPALKAKKTK